MPDPSKTERATPKKRRDERKKGHVPMSNDAVSVLTLFGSIFMLRLTFGNIAEAVGYFTRYCMELARGGLMEGLSDNLFPQAVILVFRTTGPLLAATILLSVAGTMFQTRMLVTSEPLKPKLSKLNPINGFQKLFSLKSLISAAMGLIKIILLLIIIYLSVREQMEVTPRYLYADVYGATSHMLLAIFSMLVKVAVAFLVLAAVDYMYQRWDYEREMRMTKQEVKDEYKQMEGDPKIKGRIRSLQMQMAQSRMMQKVPEADVIIRNPTHVAVALRYHPGEDDAPVVLAMGVDHLAQRIIEVAESHGITVMENVPLARALYAEAELDRPIPPDLYEAVAEVMVYLYKLGRIEA